MKYRVLFLDFYGTLVAEDDVIISAICSRLPHADDEVRRKFATRWSQIFAESCLNSFAGSFQTQREIETASLSSAMSEFALVGDSTKASEELYDYWKNPAAFPESDAFLSSCPLPVCIVSNIDTADILSAAQNNGWTFQHLITSESARAYKPRPEMFQAALSLMRVDPASVLHVGDSLSSDIRGAAALGIDTVWINRKGRKRPENSIAPTFEFRDLLKLLALLKQGTDSQGKRSEKLQ